MNGKEQISIYLYIWFYLEFDFGSDTSFDLIYEMYMNWSQGVTCFNKCIQMNNGKLKSVCMHNEYHIFSCGFEISGQFCPVLTWVF